MFTLHLLKQRRISKRQVTQTQDDPIGRSTQFQDGKPMTANNVETDSQRIPAMDLEHASRELEEEPEEERVGIWGFTRSEIERFPALRKRNFWCIQRHSATAMHYDLRMQVDDGTVSWAIPKGLLGISKKGESSRLAVETTIHPISYTTYEGADGRNFSAGRKGGTLLWDIGEYTITKSSSALDSTSDEERPSKRKRKSRSKEDSEEEGSEDRDGRYQEDLFRQFLYRKIGYGKSRSIHFMLHGGRKVRQFNYFILVLASSNKHTFSSSGQIKKNWFLRLPREVDEYLWDQGGEEGDFWGSSVKTGRTLKEVTEGYVKRPERWEKEEERFKNWFGDED
ncbi:DNA ligase D, 3'-phosphoesterase domain-containing protein [Kwoniella sp. B9012]